MSDDNSTAAAMRSDQRIPRLRTRGRANRQKLLSKAEQLIEEAGGKPVRFSDIFKSAGVSRGSAYRIYDGKEDLMQDLATSWLHNFVEYLRGVYPDEPPGTWAELSDEIVSRGAEYWLQTANTLRVLPRVRNNVPESYRSAVIGLTNALSDTYNEYFVMPVIEDWMTVLAMYVSLGDTIFADAFRRDGRISKQRLREAQVICKTYLAFYLPDLLPVRARPTKE